ncbi:MAG: DUF3128 domain-containing protein [Prevotella sp.]|nr:DUF3128 domain-containing protein [Prevotella sp.]
MGQQHRIEHRYRYGEGQACSEAWRKFESRNRRRRLYDFQDAVEPESGLWYLHT